MYPNPVTYIIGALIVDINPKKKCPTPSNNPASNAYPTSILVILYSGSSTS
jgi:hypothetical protein